MIYKGSHNELLKLFKTRIIKSANNTNACMHTEPFRSVSTTQHMCVHHTLHT